MSSWGKTIRGSVAAGAVRVVSGGSSAGIGSDVPAAQGSCARAGSRRSRALRSVRVVGAVFAVGAVVGATGCSGGSHSGTAVGSGTAASVSVAPTAATPASNTAWNPCSIPDADIAAAGLNPSTKEVGSAGVTFPGWDICTWDSNSGEWYALELYSTSSHTYDEVVHNTTLFKNPRPVTVGGRAGMVLPHANESDACTVALDAKNPVQVAVSTKPSADSAGDPCAEAARIAGVLLKDLPAAK